MVWTDVTPNPKDHEIEAGYERYREAGCDVVLGIGGGSVIDAAKGVALLAANGGRILDYEGIDRIEHPIPPLIMMPSTSGTGADVSQFCIVTDTVRHTKITIMGRALVPDVSVIDPRLLTTMSEWLSAATGLDALTHGIEAFVSLAHGPLTDHHALQAIAMVNGNLARTIHRPDDIAARAVHGPGRARGGPGVHQRDPRRHARDEPPGRRHARPAARRRQRGAAAARHPVQRRGAAGAVRADRAGHGAGRGGRAARRGRRAGGRGGARARRRGRRAPRARRPRRARGGHPAAVELTLADACLTTNPRQTSVDDVMAMFRAAL